MEKTIVVGLSEDLYEWLEEVMEKYSESKFSYRKLHAACSFCNTPTHILYRHEGWDYCGLCHARVQQTA